MFKNILLSGLLLLTTIVFAEENGSPWHSFGITYYAGLRYDDVRMCVASAAGVKGGPVGDVQLSASYLLGPRHDLIFSLPVGRPVLFGLAFQMLQFEPEVTLAYRSNPRGENAVITGVGLGLSLNKGPGYEADLDNRGPIFFSSGPFISFLVGWERHSEEGAEKMIGLRLFYTPLISDDPGPDGIVYGAAFEFTRYF